jgi:hypothetical protein
MAKYQEVALNGQVVSIREPLPGGGEHSFAIGHEPQEYLDWLAAGNTPDPPTPPALIFSEAQNLQAKVRTTDAVATQLARWTLNTLTGYDVELRLLAVDSANGVMKKIVADMTLERLNAGALLIGQTVLASHQSTGAPATASGVANWAVSASISGNDVVITVTGAASRTIDWLVNGRYATYVPAGR